MRLFCPRMETLNEQLFFSLFGNGRYIPSWEEEGKGVDNAFHWSTHYPRDSVVGFVSEQPWLGNYVLEKSAYELKKTLTATARLYAGFIGRREKLVVFASYLKTSGSMFLQEIYIFGSSS